MKVICIQADTKLDAGPPDDNQYLIEGNVYTVLECRKRYSKNYYSLVELGPDLYFNQSLFVPCSEIDEKEMIRELNKEKV